VHYIQSRVHSVKYNSATRTEGRRKRSLGCGGGGGGGEGGRWGGGRWGVGGEGQ
jgi:hypothetical protein